MLPFRTYAVTLKQMRVNNTLSLLLPRLFWLKAINDYQKLVNYN